MTQAELCDRICVLFGGRVAESLACGEISTGGEDDLQRATEIARQMVVRFGMSKAIGPRTIDLPAAPWFGPPREGGPVASEETRQTVDKELRAILEEQQMRARRILEHAQRTLDAVVTELLAKETLQREDLARLMGGARAR
jgi:cell division protease FtsH